MGGSSSKQDEKRRSTFKKVLRLQKRNQYSDSTTRPMSYAGDDQLSELSTRRPMSMFESLPPITPRQSQENLNEIRGNTNLTTVAVRYEDMADVEIINKSNESLVDENRSLFDENDWKFQIPLTMDKIAENENLKSTLEHNLNDEMLHIFRRLITLEKTKVDSNDFVDWFLSEVEYSIHSFEENGFVTEKSLLLRSIEQDRFDCMKYLFEHHLLPSKLAVNSINNQGRHCLLMLAHRNGPIESIEYLLKNYLSCLDTNKLDLNQSSSLHHACRHFNLQISQLILPYTNRKVLQMENSELHTPLDYWLECLCSLKKLKPTHIQHHADSLKLDNLLNKADYYSNVIFFQNLINHGGQLTKIPLRYIRSILPQLTFEQKLSYVDHHVNLCCTLYKNRLSTLIRDYDNLKISIQAGEILTEFIYALGTVQLEVQNRLAAHAYSTMYPNVATENEHDQEVLQSTMRMLYFKFFRLFQCIYTNPDVNVKNFHFEHIFRRVWVFWKEPVRAFLVQCREKNSSLKSQCRILLFKRLNHFPADVQNLPINTALKQFLTFDNQYFHLAKRY